MHNHKESQHGVNVAAINYIILSNKVKTVVT